MVSSILVVGATGNTGRPVVERLSSALSCSPFASYRILALTRSTSSPNAQALSKLASVEVVEFNWTEITADWLREHEVKRAFIASHNQTNQFAEESTFHIEALNADVEYVVRISTAAPNVRPDCRAYYPRTHWAIEAMLSTPEFDKLKWTSLQPNLFSTSYLLGPLMFIKNFHETGKQGPLSLMASEDGPVAVIDPEDIGRFAAKLLLTEDISKHNKARYILNGPESITGRQLVALIEGSIRQPVQNVIYKDLSGILGYMIASAPGESKNVLTSVKHSAESFWNGELSGETTSKEVLELAPPKITVADVLQKLLTA